MGIRDEALAGWWVAESPRAHPFGHVDDDLLVAGTTVELPAGEHIARGFDGNVPAADQGMRVTGGEVAAVDRRRVFDGRSFVRLAGGPLAGAWVELAAGAGPAESTARPSVVEGPRGAVARLVLDAADRPAFRFDEAGRVIGRRTLADAHTLGLTTDATLVIGGHAFVRIASGNLAGWTLAESPGVQIVPLVQGADAAD